MKKHALVTLVLTLFLARPAATTGAPLIDLKKLDDRGRQEALYEVSELQRRIIGTLLGGSGDDADRSALHRVAMSGRGLVYDRNGLRTWAGWRVAEAGGLGRLVADLERGQYRFLKWAGRTEEVSRQLRRLTGTLAEDAWWPHASARERASERVWNSLCNCLVLIETARGDLRGDPPPATERATTPAATCRLLGVGGAPVNPVVAPRSGAAGSSQSPGPTR